jgi:hypothetical protein
MHNVEGKVAFITGGPQNEERASAISFLTSHEVYSREARREPPAGPPKLYAEARPARHSDGSGHRA